MDEIFAVVGIGICIFVFVAALLAMGSVYGGSWSSIAQGVTPFIILITLFAIGAYVLVKWLR